MEDISHEDLLRALTGGAQVSQSTVDQIKSILPEILQEVDGGVEILDEVLDKYAPKLAEYAEKLRSWSVGQDLKTYNELVKGGLSEDSAIRLMIESKRTQSIFQNILQNLEIQKQ